LQGWWLLVVLERLLQMAAVVQEELEHLAGIFMGLAYNQLVLVVDMGTTALPLLVLVVMAVAAAGLEAPLLDILVDRVVRQTLLIQADSTKP
jgi:hypothetical protein